MSVYSDSREELLKCIDDLFAMENIRGCPCEELRERIEATIEGISTAVEKGMIQRSKDEEELKKRSHELGESFQTLDAMRDRLVTIKSFADDPGRM